MNISSYTISQIETADKIYIDTSALMNSEELEVLINRIKNQLMQDENKIFVSRAVCLELARHLESTDEKKQQLALDAFEVLAANQEIFELENRDLSTADICKAFADAELLAKLTENRPEYKQLLITNDKRLGYDAYDLNNLESCKGYQIRVCYINHAGNLHACEQPYHAVRQIVQPETKEIVKEVIKEVKVIEPQKKEQKGLKRVKTVALLTAGYLLGTYQKNIIRYIKKTA